MAKESQVKKTVEITVMATIEIPSAMILSQEDTPVSVTLSGCTLTGLRINSGVPNAGPPGRQRGRVPGQKELSVFLRAEEVTLEPLDARSSDDPGSGDDADADPAGDN